MRRIESPTAQIDKFGTGKNGFTDGDALSGIPPTQLRGSWFDSAQEEIARAVEGSGNDLSPANNFQLDDTVQGAATRSLQGTDLFRVLRGLTFTLTGGSLTVTLDDGEITVDGRRYVVTDAKLAAGSFDSWALTASRDTYFYIAPEDPGALASPPDRTTIYLERVETANGAGAPATPAGTSLFAMVASDGTEATDVTYYNRGPAIVATGGGICARPPTPIAGTGVPNPAGCVDVVPQIGHQGVFAGENLGSLDHPSASRPTNLSFFNGVHSRRRRLRTSVDASAPMALVDEYTFHSSTAAGGTTHVALTANDLTLDDANFSDATVVRANVTIVAMDETDPTDCYSATLSGHAHLDGGAWTVVSSTVLDDDVGGEAIVAAAFENNAGVLSLALTGHSTDALRWFAKVEIVMTGPAAP